MAQVGNIPAATVCVVVPLLDEARYVRPALEGLTRQEGVRLDVVVFDAGSTDGTVEIVREFPFRVEVVPGLGQMAAINRGWRATQAEFVTWMAGDDRLRPGALARLAEALRQHPEAGAVHAEADLIDGGSHRFGHLAPGEIQLADLLFDFSVVMQTVLFRREAVARAGYCDETRRLAADYDLMLRVAKDWRLHFEPFTAADYRLHAGSEDARHLAEVGQTTLDVVAGFFSRLDLSPEQRHHRPRALAGAHLMAATCCAMAGQRWAGWKHWSEAVRLHPAASLTTQRGLGALFRLVAPVQIRPYQLREWRRRLRYGPGAG